MRMDHSPLVDCYRALGFDSVPFSLTPDTSLFFSGSQYAQAYNQIVHACLGGMLAVLTGEVGLGKTLIVRYVMRNLPEQVKVAYLLNPLLDPQGLLRSIHEEFTGEPLRADLSMSEIQASLVQHVLLGSVQGNRFVVIVDEAHRLSPDALEMLRLLSNLETEQFKLIGLVLVGQPELERTLMLRAMRPLRERIGVWLRLAPMERDECDAYVSHRIRRTLGKGSFSFTPLALWWLHRRTRGVPRRINLAGERALMLAYAGNTDRVTWSMARAACREFQKGWT